MIMEKNKNNAKDIIFMAIGECLVAVVVILGFLIAKSLNLYEFSYQIITGSILGIIVTLLNYTFLILSVDKAINNFLALRGERK